MSPNSIAEMQYRKLVKFEKWPPERKSRRDDQDVQEDRRHKAREGERERGEGRRRRRHCAWKERFCWI